ncbi:MAG TPA: DUF1844 domain-containing protein [Terriglobales bacterium]|nr:DUF1844 domain-containing protein [Terriglobales bacterium]
MAENKQDFVVSDRRRFGSEGELRDEVRSEEEDKAKAAAPPQQQAPPAIPNNTAAAPQNQQEMPAPPTVQEQHEQNEAYKASGKKLDEIVSSRLGAQGGNYPEMNFERVVESFYMSALIQMGAVRQEGEAPAVDIIGARQTIDSLTILQEKTKGNLTDREQTLLQNVLFELRMAWIELTNAIAKGAAAQPQSGAGPVSVPEKK